MRPIGACRRGFSIPTIVRHVAIATRIRARRIGEFLKAASAEIRRLNALGIPEGGGADLTRRQRSAIARRALSERYCGHTRCC